MRNLNTQANGVAVGSGLGFVDLLQIVFIVLKLCGVIDWHWALVLLPIIIEVGLLILVPPILILVCWLVSRFGE